VVYLVGTLAALALGIGYVLQQRVAATMTLDEVLRVRLLLDLMRLPQWWIGIGFMVVGQILAAFALQLATVAVVEPLLSASLLFALAVAALLARKRITWQEVVGAALLSAALAVFISVCDPHSSPAPDTDNLAIVIAVASVVVAVLVLVAIAKRRGRVGESVLIATAAGLLYGLQDASTRAAFLRIDRHGLATLPVNPWMYIVVGSAAVGILLTQSAFKVARLDYSLPPIAAAEPVAGTILGISLLGDVFSLSIASLVVLPFCIVAMIAGAVLIGRSPNLAARPGVD
jgi:drug/metabolite transporter (DMT)-like permease